MNELLLDPFRHNTWATRELVAFCRGLSAGQLEATSVGTYGGVRATLQHILDAEGYYRWLLSGDAPEWWSKEELPPAELSAIDAWNEEMGEFWEELFSRPFDPEEWVSDRDEGIEYEAASGLLVAQILNHGNEHRSQVCTILSSLGIEPPRVDGWAYGSASDRYVERKST